MFFRKVGSFLFYLGITVVFAALAASCVNYATLFTEEVRLFPLGFWTLGAAAFAGAILWAIGFLMQLCVNLGEAAKCCD